MLGCPRFGTPFACSLVVLVACCLLSNGSPAVALPQPGVVVHEKDPNQSSDIEEAPKLEKKVHGMINVGATLEPVNWKGDVEQVKSAKSRARQRGDKHSALDDEKEKAMLRSINQGNATVDIQPIFGPWYGHWWMNVLGSNYGTNDYTPRAAIGPRLCRETQWMSDSSVFCQIPPGHGNGLTILVGVGGQAGGLTNAFYYTEPEMTDIEPKHGPTTGSFSVSIQGVNFGQFDTSPEIKFGHTACEHSSWFSDSTIACRMPAGVGAGLGIGFKLFAWGRRRLLEDSTALSLDDHSILTGQQVSKSSSERAVISVPMQVTFPMERADAEALKIQWDSQKAKQTQSVQDSGPLKDGHDSDSSESHIRVSDAGLHSHTSLEIVQLDHSGVHMGMQLNQTSLEEQPTQVLEENK